MGGTIDIDELKQYAAQQAQNKTTNATNAQQWNGWQPQVTHPITLPQVPFNGLGGLGASMPFHPRLVLSDFDIELMAACIANKHPVVDGQSHCFCTLKRLERGISKD